MTTMPNWDLALKRLIVDSLPDSDDDVNIIVSRKIEDNRLIIGVSNVHADEHKEFEIVLKEIPELSE